MRFAMPLVCGVLGLLVPVSSARGGLERNHVVRILDLGEVGRVLLDVPVRAVQDVDDRAQALGDVANGFVQPLDRVVRGRRHVDNPDVDRVG